MDNMRHSLAEYLDGNLPESAKLLNVAHLKVYEGCRVYRDISVDDCIDMMEYIKGSWPDELIGDATYVRTLSDMNRAIGELCLQFCSEEM